MKKIFLVIFCIFVTGCASKPAPVSAPAPKIETPKPEPVPSVSVEVGENMYSVICSYSGREWWFITAVWLQNERGEIKKYKFKDPRRKVWDNGTVSETCVYTSIYADEFREWVNGGQVKARVISDKYRDFEPVEIKED